MRLADISLNEDTGRVGHSVGHTSQHHLAAQHAGSLTILLRPAPEQRPESAPLAHPPRPPHRDRDLDRTDLPPPPTTSPPGTLDPHRVRDHHDHTGRPSRLTQPVTKTCSSPEGFGCASSNDHLRSSHAAMVAYRPDTSLTSDPRKPRCRELSWEATACPSNIRKCRGPRAQSRRERILCWVFTAHSEPNAFGVRDMANGPWRTAGSAGRRSG